MSKSGEKNRIRKLSAVDIWAKSVLHRSTTSVSLQTWSVIGSDV